MQLYRGCLGAAAARDLLSSAGPCGGQAHGLLHGGGPALFMLVLSLLQTLVSCL